MDEGRVVRLDKPLRVGGGPRVVGVATGVARAEMGGDAPPSPPAKGVKMFELAQLNLLTPEVKKGGGQPLAIHRRMLAFAGTGGDGVCGKDLDLGANLIGAHGDGGVRPGGGPPGGVCRIGTRHCPPAQVQAQARRNPCNLGTPVAAAPQPPGRLRQCHGGHLPHLGPARQGMFTAFPLDDRGQDPYGIVPCVGHTRYVPWKAGGNGGTVSQVMVLGDRDEELDPGDWWVVSQG